MSQEPDGRPGSVIEWLTALASSNRITVWVPLTFRDHWASLGGLETSMRTGESRTRFQFDDSWNCGECRPFKEEKEGKRILEAFIDREMWVTRFPADMRSLIRPKADSAGVDFVAVPIHGGFAVLTTGPLDITDNRSELVEARFGFITEVVMKLRGPGSISGSRRFLPPARVKPPFHESYHKGTSRRCWHLHSSKEEAQECARQLDKLDGGRGWQVRSVSQWRKVGRFEVVGDELRRLADSLGIKTSMDLDSRLGFMTFEAMGWTDPRFVNLRREARWKPPWENFVPPPLAITLTVNTNTGAATG